MIPLEEFNEAIEDAWANVPESICRETMKYIYRAGAEAAYNIIEASLTDDGK